MTNYKNDNLLVLIDSIRVLSKIIFKFRHLKYRSDNKIVPLVEDKIWNLSGRKHPQSQ